MLDKRLSQAKNSYPVLHKDVAHRFIMSIVFGNRQDSVEKQDSSHRKGIRKLTTEECLSLDIRLLSKQHAIFPGAKGEITWMPNSLEARRRRISFATSGGDELRSIHFRYVWNDLETITEDFRLVPTSPNFGRSDIGTTISCHRNLGWSVLAGNPR